MMSRTELPVASAATASVAATASAASAPSTAPTTTGAAAASTTAASMATTASATSATFALRTRFIYNERAAKKILAVERADCLLRVLVFHFGEAKPTRLPRKAIAQQRQRIRLHADFREQRLDLLFRGLEREIAHVQFLHGRSPCAPNMLNHSIRS
jgi:hypothetical protein